MLYSRLGACMGVILYLPIENWAQQQLPRLGISPVVVVVRWFRRRSAALIREKGAVAMATPAAFPAPAPFPPDRSQSVVPQIVKTRARPFHHDRARSSLYTEIHCCCCCCCTLPPTLFPSLISYHPLGVATRWKSSVASPPAAFQHQATTE